MPRMCPANRRMAAWVDEHHAEVSAWLALHDGGDLSDLDVWEKCDLAYAMITAVPGPAKVLAEYLDRRKAASR